MESTKNPQEIHKEYTVGNMQFFGDPPKIAALAAKLARISGTMTRVPKKGHNSFANYDFVREADVIDHVRPMLAENNLYIFFSSEPLTTQYDHRETSDKKRQIWASVEMRATIIDGDSGAYLSFTMPGQALDTNGDKAIYKAITGAKKYATMLAFNVATGDDPENDEKRKRSSKGDGDKPSQDDADADAREASKARQQIVGKFPVMRDEQKRNEICHGLYGKPLHEFTLKECRDLYAKLNKGQIGG